MTARTWLLGYTCQAHRFVNATPAETGLTVENCACKPSLPMRILWLLGLRFLEECAPAHPIAEPEPRWCAHTWPATTPNETHACQLPAGHGAPEHECDCGARKVTDRAADRLLRMVRLSDAYGDCLWPEDECCPRHDCHEPWPPGRDCTGTCTNCNATVTQCHEPSCPYRDSTEPYPWTLRKA